MNREKEGFLYLHPVTERIWHLIHAAVVLLLILSGTQIHWPDGIKIFSSFKQAVSIHNTIGLIAVADFLLWFWYNLLSKRITHYLFVPGDLRHGVPAQARYYTVGIFKGETKPFRPAPENRFNPLQKLTYFVVMFVLVPLLLASGILFMYPMAFSGLMELFGGLKVVAGFHILLAFTLVSFLIIHLYLATIGAAVLDQYKSIITGWAVDEG